MAFTRDRMLTRRRSQRSRLVEWTPNAWRVFAIAWLSPLLLTACRFEDSFIFHPTAAIDRTPRDVGLDYQNIDFTARDGVRLNGWFVPHAEARSTLIWFHGNAGNIGNRLAQLHLLYTRIGGSHFLFDYRGYGKSRGRPTSAGILADGRDAVALADARGWTADRQVVYFGESLGCAVAVALAVEHAPARVILSAPFYSLRAMGDVVLPPLAFLAGEDFNSARLIERLPSPLLVIHGTVDGTVPFQQGQDLYALAPHPKRFYAVPDAGHTDMHEVGGETYIQVLREFLSGQVGP